MVLFLTDKPLNAIPSTISPGDILLALLSLKLLAHSRANCFYVSARILSLKFCFFIFCQKVSEMRLLMP